jgi:hypothetical protein
MFVYKYDSMYNITVERSALQELSMLHVKVIGV